MQRKTRQDGMDSEGASEALTRLCVTTVRMMFDECGRK